MRIILATLFIWLSFFLMLGLLAGDLTAFFLAVIPLTLALFLVEGQ